MSQDNCLSHCVSDRYLPIEDYGLIGNLHTAALVSIKGSIDYLCLPRFDSPSVFLRILDASKGGSFSFDIEDKNVRYKQLYLPGTNILVTRFLGDDGIAEVIDFMPIAKGECDFAICRRLKGIYGNHTVRVNISPRYDYARQTCIIERHPKNCGYVFRDPSGQFPAMTLLTDLEMEIHDDTLTGVVHLERGKDVDLILTLRKCDCYRLTDWMKQFQKCYDFWQAWSQKCTYQGDWRETVVRSALALKLLTSVQYGSMVASPTFGLPESLGGERNWDYRYCWIRDSAFTMYSFLRLGYREEADQFVEWIRKKCGAAVQLMYGVDGREELVEEVLDHLEGYKGSKPVRIGNGAYNQDQMDIYGELIDTIYLYNNAGGSITYEFWGTIKTIVEFVIKHWRNKDHGIWEVRSGRQRFLHSTMCCWVAIDRAMRIGDDRGLPYPEPSWREARNIIYEEIYHDFWNEELGCFVQYKGSDVIDASALLMPLLRFVSSKEPRWQSTFKVIEEKLKADVLVFRYKAEHGAADGLEGDEATFTICSFWYVECLARIGRVEEAMVAFEKLLGYSNHLGLLSEEIGIHGEQLGNFPQAFSHLSLISAAFQINKRSHK